MTLRDNLIAAGSVATLALLLASFVGVDFSHPPPQHISPVTGFPTWHQDYVHETREVTFSFTLLALLFSTGAAFAAHRSVRNPSRSLTGFVTLQTGIENASTQINQFILIYIDATWIAIIAYMFLDVGKIWAVVGALHNLLEVALLILLQSGGRVNSMSFGLYMFLYVCVTILLSVYLQWPLDAVFFRWQGLCSDFGLIVVFVRTYFSTKKQLSAFGSPDRHDLQLAKAQQAADMLEQQQLQQQLHPVASSSLQSATMTPPASAAASPADGRHHPLHHLHPNWKKFVARAPSPAGNGSDDSDAENASAGLPSSFRHHQERRQQHTNSTLTPESAHSSRLGGGETVIEVVNPSTHAKVSVVALNNDSQIWGVQWKNPEQLLLLVAAAIFHVIGNCVTTIWITNLYAMAVFQISYGVSFPLYAYYLYVDNHALRQTKVYLPDFKSKVKNLTGFSLALIGATATVRAGLYVATQTASQGLL
ncbi:hypothetical protein EMPS_05880 [Entomortierella parvispora]|uniref:Uncharacterized protein n=1 Tax=Entomortierella parvispora TaxID=205924 RepID=A0A9P3LWX6_9FUNG|nr:hypothetical protein EMPS_05880 [Entomortierella parvispora]